MEHFYMDNGMWLTKRLFIAKGKKKEKEKKNQNLSENFEGIFDLPK